MSRPGATGKPPPPPGPGTLWDRTSRLGRVLGALDDAGDALFAPWRGRRSADAVAALASNLSDPGAVWVALAVAQGWRRGPSRRRAVVALAGAGSASYVVNRTVKRLAGRARPGAPTPDRVAGGPGGAVGGSAAPGALVVPVRRPSSTSFPSGHVLAAFCTALVLPATRSGRALALAFATLVAASRVHLRAHHTSDVLGGAIVGAGTAAAVRPLVDACAARRPGGCPPARPRCGAE